MHRSAYDSFGPHILGVLLSLLLFALYLYVFHVCEVIMSPLIYLETLPRRYRLWKHQSGA